MAAAAAHATCATQHAPCTMQRTAELRAAYIPAALAESLRVMLPSLGAERGLADELGVTVGVVEGGVLRTKSGDRGEGEVGS